MSKYLLNKFLFTVDRDRPGGAVPHDPAYTVQWWEAGKRTDPELHQPEQSTWLRLRRPNARRSPRMTTRSCSSSVRTRSSR
jgi:hypothetical protein